MSKMENFGFWLSRTFATTKAKNRQWPFVPGTYFVNDPDAPVAVTTLGSVRFANGLDGDTRKIVGSPGMRPMLPTTGEDELARFTDQVELVDMIGCKDPAKIKLDKSGYFVVNIEGEEILCEHYDYKDRLVRNIRGKCARDMYLTMIDNGWISRIDHACYVGKELAKAELSIRHGFEYLQDGA